MRFIPDATVLVLVSWLTFLATGTNAADHKWSAGTKPAMEVLYTAAPSMEMKHAALSALSEDYIDVLLHQTPSGCVSQYGALKIKIQADLGEDYNLGENAFTATINATLTTYSDLSTPIQSWPIAFNLNQNAPEQLLIRNVTSNPAQVKYVKIKINSYSNPVVAAQNAIRLRAWTEEEDFVSITGVSVSVADFSATSGQWEQTFTWASSCTQVPAYVFQLIRIYNGEAPDWNRALTIHTESSATSLKVSLAEGSGLYKWRVTPLGNLSGGVTNPANWGTPSNVASVNAFIHPETNTNWIYSRTFTEGNHVHEQVSYANGLQQVAQQQTRIQDDNQIVATQTVQDIIGRNAIVSLPIPAAGKDKLSYIPKLLKNASGAAAYRAEDFLDPKTPSEASDFSGYYGPTTNDFNRGVPQAGGYPFTQAVFAKDGSGRVREQSGVGEKHSVVGGKTVRTFYTHPTETELLRLFGKETPDISSIQKVVTFDPNGSASVSYQTKDGKVIATALGVSAGPSPLEALQSAGDAIININEEVKNPQRINDRTIVSRKPLFVEADRSLIVDYQVSPASVAEVCGNSSMTGLVAYYAMEGNLNDLSSTNNPATVSGGVTLSQDAQGALSAYTTNGINGYIIANDVSQTDINTGDFTIGYWVKKNAVTAAGKNIAGVGKWNAVTPDGSNEWSLDLSSNGTDNRAAFSIQSGNTTYKVSGTADLVVGQWYYVAATRSGTQLAIFVNGVQQNTLTIPAGIAVNNLGRSMWIGRQGANYTNAAFDDVQVYNRALSSLEVAQLLKRGPVCKTCDYRVDILLYKEGDVTPLTIGSRSIESVNCANQSSVVWDPMAFPPVTLSGGVNYVLEKRITLQTIDPASVTTDPATARTYLESHLAAVENFYRTQYDAQLLPINNLLDAGDMTGLYSSMTYGADDDGYFYPLLPTGSDGCQDILRIPVIDPCPTETFTYDASCNRNGQSFEDFFASYYAGHETITPLRGDGKLSYMFFKNLYTNTNEYFAPGQFNTMVANMIADNGLSCETVWDIWDEEVKGYESKEGAVFEETPDPLYSFATPENNMFQSFLSAIEARLQERLEADQPSKDICRRRKNSSYPYYIRKTQLYGFFIQPPATGSAVVAPDLIHAYRLAYYNDALTDKSHIKALMFYSGLHTQTEIETPTIVPSGQYFHDLDSCDQYRFYTNTQIGNTGPSETVIQSIIAKMRSNCGEACETRAQEFRQAIIRSIFLTAPTTEIEHYNVYLDSNLDGDLVEPDVQAMYVGVYDPSVNTTTFTISECSLESMVDAMVVNCKNNYCNTTLTIAEEEHPDKPGFTVLVYGTPEERAKLRKPLDSEFEIQVNMTGQSCSAGWDAIAAKGADDDNFIPIKNIMGANSAGQNDHAINWHYTIKNGHLYTSLNSTSITYAGGTIPTSNGMAPFVSKVDLEGSLQWLNFLAPGPGIGIDKVEVDNSGDSYAIKFNTINGTATQSLVKLGSNGTTLWSRDETQLGFKNYYASFEFALAPNGDVFVIGNKLETDPAYINNPSLIIKKVLSNGTVDPSFLITIYRPSPAFSPMKITPAGEIILFFNYNGSTVTLGVGEPNQTTISQTSGGILAMFNPNGTLKWVQHHAFGAADVGTSFLCDASGNIYHFTPTGVIKRSGNGAMVWNKSLPIPDIALGRFEINTGQNVITYYSKVSPTTTKQVKIDLDGNIIQEKQIFVKNLSTFYCVEDQDDIYIAGTAGGNGIFIAEPSLVSYGTINFLLGKYGVGDPNCTRPSMCFRFTSPKEMSITIPDSIEVEDIYTALPETCNSTAASIVRNSIQQQKEQFIAARVKNYRNVYTTTCGDPALIQDKLTITYSTGLHHFTLYYHDRAGNLIRTVPPEGVVPMDISDDVKKATARNTFPSHTLVTEYQYNSLGQLINTHSPDGNFDSDVPADYVKPVAASTPSQVTASKYYTTSIYNDKGQFRFSANALQKKNNAYSYTKYDALGRVVEVGESSGFNESVLMSKRNEVGRAGHPIIGNTQITSTYYTDAYTGTLPAGYVQRHLDNRVSYAMLDEDGAGTAEPVTTVYSYDPHGNVEWLIQAIPGLAPVAITHAYDLISGKVLQVKYNPGNSDQFFHKYEYDGNNRIVRVYTSTDGALWERDAKYEYYKHGPLKRTVIGEDLVQGLDYTYTIHGWLKGLNHQYLDIDSDPMNDAGSTEVAGAKNHITGRDAFGMALQYYADDYLRPGSTFDAAYGSRLLPASPARDLFNGNISTWASNGAGWASAAKYPTLTLAHKGVTGYRYTYDQLNRLKTSSFVSGTAYTPSADYAANYTYSPDGNILTAVHKGNGANFNLDNLTYGYVPGTHRLDKVAEAEAVSAAEMDVENQAAGNYTYDPIGNLIGDAQQGTTITWTPYGKVLQVTKGTSTTRFMYDAAGNRVMKKRTSSGGVSTTNFYVRDAGGNIMGVYERIDEGSTTGATLLTELPLYGSDRLGTYSRALTPGTPVAPLAPGEVLVTSNTSKAAYEGVSYVYTPNANVALVPGFSFAATNTAFRIRSSTTQPETETYTRTLGSRQYELKDHLGNVRAVVGDVKLSTIENNAPKTFEPKLLSLNNYYPFGMDQPGRMWSASGKYRYGFNGKEKDDNGEWGQTAYDYGFRIYNPAIGKFLSVDPLTRSYPWNSPYAFAENGPIENIDLDGLERFYYKVYLDQKTGQPLITFTKAEMNEMGFFDPLFLREEKTGEKISTMQFRVNTGFEIHDFSTAEEMDAWFESYTREHHKAMEAEAAILAGYVGLQLGMDMYNVSNNPMPIRYPSPSSIQKDAFAAKEKFSDYIFKPGADHGKDKVFKNLGYNRRDSKKLAKIWESQAKEKYNKKEYTLGKKDKYGQRINIEIEVNGTGGHKGKKSFMNSGWLIQEDGSIRLATPFSGFTKPKSE